MDRRKQLVKLMNGEYVSLAKIENALTSSRYVEAACVVTRSDKLGMIAVVTPSSDFEGGDLLSLLKPGLDKTLMYYEVPKKVLVVTEVWTPESGLVTASMKICRKKIEDFYSGPLASAFDYLK